MPVSESEILLASFYHLRFQSYTPLQIFIELCTCPHTAHQVFLISTGYHGPNEVYKSLNSHEVLSLAEQTPEVTEFNVRVGKEWHSSFFLPNKRWDYHKTYGQMPYQICELVIGCIWWPQRTSNITILPLPVEAEQVVKFLWLQRWTYG